MQSINMLVGEVINTYTPEKKPEHDIQNITISFPTRLNAMALDPSKIDFQASHIYTAGEIYLSVQLYLVIKISKTSENKTKITGTKRTQLIVHAVKVFQKCSNTKDYLDIQIYEGVSIPHAGMGSSSRLIAATMVALNELYNNPYKPETIMKLAVQNHAEETNNSKILAKVQCLGGSAASGIFPGSAGIIIGEARVVANTILPESEVIIAIPKDYQPLDAEALLLKEVKNFPKFIKTGITHSPEIAYRVLHNIIPDLMEKEPNITELSRLIFDYRFKMGSIKNCSFCYPGLVDLGSRLSKLFINDKCKLLSLSSVGPGFFMIPSGPKDTKYCIDFLTKNNCDVYLTKLENKTYTVLR